MIPYGRQHIDKKDIKEVVNVLKSEYLTTGPKVLEFERELCKYTGAKYAVVVNNGTSALHLAYLAAGFREKCEIITTPNTFVSTTNMMLTVGAKPVFCDINLDSYNIDENKIESLITKNTKGIVPVHFAGNSCDMDVILKIAKKYKLIVIEDASHALGAKYKNKKIGSLKSDMATFSFHPVKSITCGEGGAIVTNNKKYYEKIILFRNHGITKDKKGKNVMTEPGFNYRLTDIQATLGISQLKKLDQFIKDRHKIVELYKKELKDVKEIILPIELDNTYSSWHIYVIRVKDNKKRDNLMKFIKKNGIGANFHYPAVYSHPYYRKHGFKKVKLKNEEIYENSCITLPCYTTLQKKDVKLVSKLIKEYFKQ